MNHMKVRFCLWVAMPNDLCPEVCNGIFGQRKADVTLVKHAQATNADGCTPCPT